MNLDSTPRQRDTSKMSALQVDLISQQTYHSVGKLLLICIPLCFSSFYFGFDLTAISNVPSFVLFEYFGQTASKPSTAGSLVGLLAIGASIGALCAPLFMKYLSRKQFLILFDIAAIIIAGIIQINNLIVLAVCKFIQGFIIGNYMAITPIYINELAPIPIQGSFGAMTQIFVVIAIVTCYTLGVIFNVTSVDKQAGNFAWRFLFSFTGMTALTQLILILVGFIPESPVSLIQRGQIEEAKKILLMFNTKKALNKAFEDASSKAVRANTLKIQINETEGGETVKIQQKKFEMPILRGAVFLAFQLPFMQQMSGTNALVTQIGLIFKDNASLSLFSPLIANIVQLIATFGSIFMLTYFGRKPLMLFGNLSLAIVDIVIAVMFLLSLMNPDVQTYNYVGLAFILLFMIIYGLTIGPVVWLYVPEIIPSRLVPPATFMNWFGCSICVIATPFVVEAVGNSYPAFFFFGGISLVFGFINIIMMKQTKGLSPKEVAELFK